MLKVGTSGATEGSVFHPECQGPVQNPSVATKGICKTWSLGTPVWGIWKQC